jgi:hypothetical protein
MHICMSCHYPVAPRPNVGDAIRWNRVASLPDYTYFDHSIHLQKGVGCSTCHGRIDRMRRVYQAVAFTMVWYLDCHRDPAPHLPERQTQFGLQLVQAYDIAVGNLTIAMCAIGECMRHRMQRCCAGQSQTASAAS